MALLNSVIVPLFFTTRFPFWSLPWVGNGGGKRQFVTPGHLSDPGGNLGKRVRLTRYLLMSFRILGIQSRGDGKDCAPLPPKERGVRWACLAIFFLDLGLGEVCTEDAWNLPSEGTGAGGFAGWSVQPKGQVHWHKPI